MDGDTVKQVVPDVSPIVYVRIALDSARLEYQGRESFFDQHIAHIADAMLGSPAARERALLALHHPAVHEPESPPAFVPSSPQRFQTFAGQVGATAATVDQRIMAFAFYLWNFERHDDFAVGDILAFFRTVHEEPPKDIEARVADLANANRFLEALPEPGRWRFTAKGINYVKNRLLSAA